MTDFGLVDAFGVAGLAFLLKKVIDWIKLIREGDINGTVTQVVAWVGGIALFWLAAASSLFAGVEVAGTSFTNLDWASKILAGLTLGSSASVVFDRLGSTGASLTSLPTSDKVPGHN